MNTGEFAAYCGVEKRTLFHYDQIGLLKPDKIQKNGYREYTAEQAEVMDTIKIMQASGYSLKEIKDILSCDANQRRISLLLAKNRLNDRIEKLISMRTYIEKKEKLWQEYQEFTREGKDYLISLQNFTYSSKEISLENHFFSFLRDGSNDTFIFHSDNRVSIAHEGGTTEKTGRAITFFLVIPSDSPDLKKLIHDKLDDFQFNGEDQAFLNAIPHLYMDAAGIAIIKVMVFEKNM